MSRVFVEGKMYTIKFQEIKRSAYLLMKKESTLRLLNFLFIVAFAWKKKEKNYNKNNTFFFERRVFIRILAQRT